MNKTGMYGLPTEVKFCKRCVISNQRPSSTVEFKNTKNTNKETIGFDSDGVCDACCYAEYKKNIDWEEREKALITLCNKHRSTYGSYDCIVPGSGGKDSAFASHILKTKYGMNPLTVTWAPHLYTDIGRKNFDNWINIGGFDNILFTPNGQVHRKLTRMAFLNLLHPFQPFIIGQKYIGPKFALKYKIPLVFYGENQAEYGNKIEENDNPKMDKKFFTGDTGSLYLGGNHIFDLVEYCNLPLKDLNPYLPLKEEEAEEIECHYLGYYLKWDPQECFYYAAKNTGFQANTERTEGSYSKYSSIDDKIDLLHYYTTLIKFGLGRASYDASQEIRNEKITREEGVALVNKFDQEVPKKYMSDCLEYLNLTEGDFKRIIDEGRPPHLWEKINNKWKLKHEIRP